MNKKKKALEIASILDKEFPNPQVPLFHTNAYTLLIAVLLSAQCTDERVNKVTPYLFALAQDPLSMSKVPVEKIEEIIRPLGLSSKKSQAIRDLSLQLILDFKGVVPSDLEQLESLPGVGHKTASVVMCQAFSFPAFPVDTHIHRCAQRWGLSSGINVKKTEEDLKKIFPRESWHKIHLQIIFFARKYCPARGHDKQKCPICSFLN